MVPNLVQPLRDGRCNNQGCLRRRTQWHASSPYLPSCHLGQGHYGMPDRFDLPNSTTIWANLQLRRGRLQVGLYQGISSIHQVRWEQWDLQVHLEELCLATGKVLQLTTPLGVYSMQDKRILEEGGRHQHLWTLWSITRMLWSSHIPPPSHSVIIDPPECGDHLNH
jgi:hypothetical protein